MIDLKEISINIKSANTILDDMIEKAREQNARNFEMLFTVKNGLNELSELLTNKNGINDRFIEKWNTIMGWVPKVFEDHPLLEILRKIDVVVMNNKM
jgi:hypothetical protein